MSNDPMSAYEAVLADLTRFADAELMEQLTDQERMQIVDLLKMVLAEPDPDRRDVILKQARKDLEAGGDCRRFDQAGL